MKRAVVALAIGLVLAGCGSDTNEPEREEPAVEELGSISSVAELRDALEAAGYKCQDWQQDNDVDLAAESGTCDDSSVLSTYASAGDLQAQLDRSRRMDQMLIEAGIKPTPNLVGPNWIFNAPAAGAYADELGGTVISPPK